MKYNNFNKFGGTELRFNSQVGVYSSILNWISMNLEELNILSPKERDKAFKDWMGKEEVYRYSEKDKINRFKMIISNLTRDFKVVKEVDGKFTSVDIDLENIKKDLFSAAQEAFDSKPFHKLLEFIHNSKDRNNLNWKKLALCFMVYDGKETMQELYDLDIIMKVAKNIDYDENKGLFEIIKFRKPPKEKVALELVFNKLIKNQTVTLEDVSSMDVQNSKHMRKIISDKPKEKIDITMLLARLNKIDAYTFVCRLSSVKVKALLEGDYLDLFNRWSRDFGLIESASKTTTSLAKDLNLRADNNKYIIIDSLEVIQFPYSEDEVNKFMNKIMNKDFSFKVKDKNISSVPNSAIAEYMVNLKFAYLHNLNVEEFSESANTKMTSRLYPVFTAPGGVADMTIKQNDGTFINVETTIHRSINQIINHEAFPITRHFDSVKKPGDKDSKLVFVSFEDDEKLVNSMRHTFDMNNKDNDLIVLKFDDLPEFQMN